MPVTKSAKKALRQNIKRRLRNLTYKKKIKTLLKQIREFVREKKIKEARELLPQAYKALDKAAKENVIKKNTASRKKSRITKLINSAEEKEKEQGQEKEKK